MAQQNLDPKFLWHVEVEWEEGKASIRARRNRPDSYGSEISFGWWLLLIDWSEKAKTERKVARKVKRCQRYCDKQNALLMGQEVKGYLSIPRFVSIMEKLQREVPLEYKLPKLQETEGRNAYRRD